MSRFLIAIFALAVGFTACAQEPAEEAGSTEETPVVDAATVEQTIRGHADTFEQAILAGDAEAVGTLYAEDAVLLPPGGARVDGRAGITEGFAAMVAGGPPTAFTLEPTSVVVAGDGSMAYEIGTWTWTGPGPDGAEMSDAGKYLVVWEPVDGEWKMAVDTWNSDVAPGGATDAAPETAEGTDTTM